MTIENTKTYRAGLLGEFWADYESRVVPDEATKGQWREYKQAFVAGAVSYVTAEQAAAHTADGPEDYARMLTELDAEAVDMGVAVVAAATDDPCDCPVCKAERGEVETSCDDDGESVSVVVMARGLDDEQKAELSTMVVDYVAKIAGATPNGVTLQ